MDQFHWAMVAGGLGGLLLVSWIAFAVLSWSSLSTRLYDLTALFLVVVSPFLLGYGIGEWNRSTTPWNWESKEVWEAWEKRPKPQLPFPCVVSLTIGSVGIFGVGSGLLARKYA